MALSIQMLDNAEEDLGHIEDVSTSTLPTATDRLGNDKMTVAGAVATIAAINPRGAWASGTLYAQKDVVSSGGVWYVCVQAHTSAASFATDAAKWRVYQGTVPSEVPYTVATYSALRSYAGDAYAVNVSGYLVSAAPDGIAGLFTRDDSDTTSADDGGTIIVASNGKRWKRVHGGRINVRWFGAKCDSGTTDNSTAVAAAADACRSSGSALEIPTVDGQYYLISDTIDLSDIKVIGGGGELRGTFSGDPAVVIGGSSSSFRNASIEIRVRNTTDKSTTSGTRGIKLLSASNSRFKIYARGFDEGLYFDGAAANRVWVDNRFDVEELYNNGVQVHFDLAGASYAVKNQFVGGSYYIGTNQTKSGRGTFKLTLAGSALVSDILVQSPEIGVDINSVASDHGLFVYANVGTTFVVNTIEFKDVRFEGYGTYTFSPYAVNIATTTSGRLGVGVEMAGSVPLDQTYSQFPVSVPENSLHRIRLEHIGVRSQGVNGFGQVVVPPETLPYQVNGRCYVPGRVIYDNATGYATPVDYFSSAYNSNSASRANGDGDIVSGITTDSFGLMYSKGTTQGVFIELHRAEQFVVICYDAAGNVLSGTAPYYVQGEGFVSRTRGAVGVYEINGRWAWIHKDVSYFYIGAARWASNGLLRDIAFTVLYGAAVTKKNDVKMSPRNLVANTAPAQCFMPLGSEMCGDAANGWRNTFYLRTASTAGAAAGATAVVAASVTGITAGDTIGIELDTEIATGLRRYQYTTVSSVAGSTINLGAALAASVASGRALLVNRWVTK